MYVNPIGTRFWLGIFTPAMRATCASPQNEKSIGFRSSTRRSIIRIDTSASMPTCKIMIGRVAAAR
jgi:hypothetical protein